MPVIPKLLGQCTVAVVAAVSQSRFSCVVLSPEVLVTKKDLKFLCTQDDLNEAKPDFYAVAVFPRVIGATDYTHVQLVYRNSKHTHSLNVQIICAFNGVITNVVIP